MSARDDQRPVAVVSGGSRGLGYALVADLVKRGYRVATFSRSESEELAGLRAGVGGDTLFWSAVDGTNPTAADEFVRTVNSRFGRIDVLVNNAGVGLEGLLTLTRTSAIDDAIQLNLALPIMLTRACLKPMLARSNGVVVNVSSINAARGQTGVAVYTAAKAGIDGLTRALAKEVGPAGIRVVGVAPGYFDSEMTAGMDAEQRRRVVRRTPLARLGTIADVVGVVGFLISPAAGFVTGVTIPVDGGYTC